MTSKVEYLGELRTRCTHLASGAAYLTDAPTDNHGKGAMFSPTDTVATALANCMITVMGIRASKENIPFKNLSAIVKKHMADQPRRVRAIDVELRVGDQWTEKQKLVLEKVGRTCPVALSLHPDIEQNISFYYE
ncbi:OsmC family protein [bacterium]|nr:OsmC family protein [bacterium]